MSIAPRPADKDSSPAETLRRASEKLRYDSGAPGYDDLFWAVSDWLDRVAERAESKPKHNYLMHHALAVANAYLAIASAYPGAES